MWQKKEKKQKGKKEVGNRRGRRLQDMGVMDRLIRKGGGQRTGVLTKMFIANI